MNYKETLDILYNMLPDFQQVGADAYKPGLERVKTFNRELGRPDRDFLSIHVAGTNGKGSVSHMLASVLQSAGYRTGLYTSPHLHDFRERIRVDGEMIPEKNVVAFTARHLPRMQELRMSFFEATMCMAFAHFRDTDVEVAVIETGLGGRLDSTNIIDPVISIITNIGMDHMTFLGDTVEKIAAEKAGIIKRGVPVVIGESDPSSAPVFVDKAAVMESPLLMADEICKCVGAQRENMAQRFSLETVSGRRFDIKTDLLGGYQCRNICTALVAIETLNRLTPVDISNRAIREGMSSVSLYTGLRGRWEVLGDDPLTVADTGHNEHGIRLVAEQIAAEKFGKLYMVVGMVSDKDFDSVLPLLPKDAHYIFTSPSVRRALPAAELAEKGARYGLHGEVVDTVPAALARARELALPTDMIFVGGSTFTVADIC